MKTAYAVLVFAFFYVASYGQESSLKFYSNFHYLNAIFYPSYSDFSPQTFHFNQFSLAYRRINKKGIIHQLEGRIYANKLNEPNKIVKQSDFHLRYELGKYLNKRLFKKVKIQLGGAARLYYLNENVESLNSSLFPKQMQCVGLNVSFFTHLEVDLSKRLYLDINTSILGVYYGIDHRYVENPAFTERQRKNTASHFDISGERLLRIGLGYKFFPKDSSDKD